MSDTMRYTKLLTALALLPFLCSCCNKSSSVKGSEEPVSPPEKPQESSAVAYVTTADKTRLFEESALPIRKAGSMAVNKVELDSTVRYQTIDGFGAALTGSSCYNLMQMEPSARNTFLKEIFDKKDGLGVSLIRVSIGSSDFGLDEYTWCDVKGIGNFAVNTYDKRDVFPVLKEIYSINPDVKIIGTPWTAPRWMKRGVNVNVDYYSWTSGRLKPSCYQDYAQYFVKWIQTMEKEGFDIYAVTLQNEPLNKGNSMSMFMTWEEQRDFIKEAVGPAFAKAGLDTKILLFDHNYNYDNLADQQEYPLKILADPEAAKYVAGTAWHNYSGNVAELDKIASKAPGKDIFFTEASIGGWNYDFAKTLINDFDNIFMQTLSRGNKGVTLWNLMLDQNSGPKRPGGCQNCYGVVTLDTNTGKVSERNTHYYQIAHASKVISQGAVRISATGVNAAGISYLAFLNPDHSYGIIALNTGAEDFQFTFSDKTNSVKLAVPAKSIASVRWKL